jgi:hypothetical protein
VKDLLSVQVDHSPANVSSLCEKSADPMFAYTSDTCDQLAYLRNFLNILAFEMLVAKLVSI